MTAGERLRELRELAELTLEDVGLKLGVTPGAVAHWERGRFTPRRGHAAKLDQMLGASGEVLAMFGYGPPADLPDELGAIRMTLDEIVATLAEMQKTLDARSKQLRGGQLEVLAAVNELRRDLSSEMRRPRRRP